MYSKGVMEVATEVETIMISDLRYPSLLKEIADPPKVLYVRGRLELEGRESVAVVGARKPTPYGIQVTERLVGAIAQSCVVVSGLAYGIDAQAHRSAVSGGGLTVAVLGSGVDDASIYPAEHRGLVEDIIRSGGAVISEYPPGTGPQRHHFPQRNRIIAGLSRKIVVVEAGAESGALITAGLGLDYNREVLAVPGPITSENSVGPNQLIAAGAKPVLSASDIIKIETVPIVRDLTEVEQIVYNTLVSGGKTIDEVVQATGLPASEVNSLITLLEMRGIIINSGSGSFGVRQ